MSSSKPSNLIKRKPAVGSNNIKSYGHENGVLEIEFMNGSVYRYTGPDVRKHYEAFDKSNSKGAYVAAYLRKCKTTKCEKL